MSFPLPPIPQNPVANTFEWREWLYKVSSALKEQAVPVFMNLDFTGSNMTAIRTRHHNDLQVIQGGASGDYNHITSAEYTKLQTLATVASTGAYSDLTGKPTLGTMAAQNVGISVTITTAALTLAGTQGSMTFTNGILTAQTQAT